jgi:hypothetical protein
MTLREYIEVFGMDERVAALADRLLKRMELRQGQITRAMTLADPMKAGAEFAAVLGGMGHSILDEDAEWILRSVETAEIEEEDEHYDKSNTPS